jgi:preprotein translocase subunit SecA
LKKISNKVAKEYEKKIEELKEQGVDFSAVERRVMLMTVDRNWIDHIDAMDQLRKGISLRAYGQVDPIISYKKEGYDMFDEMVARIQRSIISVLLKVKIETRPAPAPMQAQPVQPTQSAPTAQAPSAAPAQPARPFRRQQPSPLSSMSSFQERIAAAEAAMKQNGNNSSDENK